MRAVANKRVTARDTKALRGTWGETTVESTVIVKSLVRQAFNRALRKRISSCDFVDKGSIFEARVESEPSAKSPRERGAGDQRR